MVRATALVVVVPAVPVGTAQAPYPPRPVVTPLQLVPAAAVATPTTVAVLPSLVLSVQPAAATAASAAPAAPVVLVVVVPATEQAVPGPPGRETLVALPPVVYRETVAVEAAARGLPVQLRPVAARLAEIPSVEAPPASVQRLRSPGLPSTTRAVVVEAAPARPTLVEQVAVVMLYPTPLVALVMPIAVVAVPVAGMRTEVTVVLVLLLLGISRLQCQRPVVP